MVPWWYARLGDPWSEYCSRQVIKKKFSINAVVRKYYMLGDKAALKRAAFL
jgi:hypothetical protein